MYFIIGFEFLFNNYLKVMLNRPLIFPEQVSFRHSIYFTNYDKIYLIV